MQRRVAFIGLHADVFHEALVGSTQAFEWQGEVRQHHSSRASTVSLSDQGNQFTQIRGATHILNVHRTAHAQARFISTLGSLHG